MDVRKYSAYGIVPFVLVLALLIGLLIQPAPVTAQNTACYRPQGGASFVCDDGGSFVVGDGATLTVQSGGTLTIESGGTLGLSGYTTSTMDSLIVAGDAVITGTGRIDGAADIGGALTVTGTSALIGSVDVTGNLEVVDHIGTSAELYLFSGDALAVTDGQVITPTESLLELTATGTVTASLATAVDGQVLILANSSNSTINIADAGTTRLSEAGALGQYDTLTLIGLGTSWYEIARSTN